MVCDRLQFALALLQWHTGLITPRCREIVPSTTLHGCRRCEWHHPSRQHECVPFAPCWNAIAAFATKVVVSMVRGRDQTNGEAPISRSVLPSNRGQVVPRP